MSNYPDVMVDTETTGLSPDHNGIIQLAAVRFNYREGTIDVENMFDRCLKVPGNRFWDPKTLQWWQKQKTSILQGIIARQEDPYLVLSGFADWVGRDHTEGPRFWAKPTHFDFPLYQSYLHQYGLFENFHYRSARDLNSFMCGLADDPVTQKIEQEIDFIGDQHNAVHDCLHQIRVLFEAKRRRGEAE